MLAPPLIINSHFISCTYLSFIVTQTFHLGLIQLLIGSNKMTNLKQATKLVQKAASNGVQVIILHEHFNSPYILVTYC